MNNKENIFNIPAEEREYAETVTRIVLEKIEEENSSLSQRRDKVLDDRRYFTDYFNEMKDDERNDWLQNEHDNLKSYDLSKTELTKLARQLGEPYFACVDFVEDGKTKGKKFYIGVGNIMHDFKLYVYDWRAPLASLYYECEVGRGQYTAPCGTIEGNILSKRKFTFENGQLVNVTDINMPSDDEFLIGILSKHADGKMKTIIDSLQKEQNRIVRDFIDGVNVIQGCAGSGKTSVALHKIAYIMYGFREKLKNREIIILSPNNIFSSYISNVLPDLGENNVTQMTQERFINLLTEECGIQYSDRGMSTERVLQLMDSRLIKAMQFKNSDLFKVILEKYCTYFEKNCFSPEALFLDAEGDEYISEEDLEFLFHTEFENTEVLLRPQMMIKYIARKNRIKDQMVLEELETKLYAMMKTCDFSVIYADLYNDKNFFDSLDEDIRDKSGDLSQYQVLPYTWEDGCAIAYLRIKLAGLESPEDVFYFFADEAQDLSPVMLAVIKAAYGGADMLFAGDNAQNVFCCGEDYTENIKRVFSAKHYKKYNLQTNYRSTKEIAEFSCNISGSRTDTACIRKGAEPVVIKANHIADDVSEWISRMEASEYVTGAVICASKTEADNLALDVQLPDEMNLNLRFLPAYIAKGLEFDCVLVVNIDDSMKKKDEILGTNMLYTACTRALHDLTVIV